MSLKLKIGLIVIGLFLLLGAVNFCIQQYLILPGFYFLEEEDARKDLARVVRAIKREIHHIDSLSHDWAAWDDTYQFVETASRDYIQANLTQSTFMDNRLSVICYIDKNGKIVWKGMRNYITGKTITIDEFSVDNFPSVHPFVSYTLGKSPLSQVTIAGIFMTSQGPLFMASRPILNSNNQGPIRGSFIMGRYFGDDMVKTLMDQTQVHFQVTPVQSVSPGGSMTMASSGLSADQPVVVEKRDVDILRVSTVLCDINNKKVLKISADIPRRIAAKGKQTTFYALGFGLIAGFIILMILYWVLQQFILRPISTLIDHIFIVGKTGDLGKRLAMPGHNEISMLAREFDNMLGQLEKRREELAGLNLALKKSQDWLAGILNSVHDPIIVWDRSYKIIWANQIALENFKSDLIGKKCNDVFSFENCSCPVCHVEKCFLTESRNEFELKFIDENGVSAEYWCTAGVAIRDEGGSAESVIVLYHDVTEKKRLKAETLRKSQLASIGELAAGVAHEINNPVNGLINYAQILVNECDRKHLAYDIALRMLKEGDRIASIVKSLLFFARGNKSEKSATNIPEVTAEVLSLIGAQLKKDGIRLKNGTEERLPEVEANFQQIQQVLLNIVVNARHALNLKYTGSHDDKQLDITCKKAETNDSMVVRIIVEDTGIGIPTDVLEKVMEPFFSTKPIGVGTGLGLSISHGIIADHGGKLCIESREGLFTRVTIDLPAKREQ